MSRHTPPVESPGAWADGELRADARSLARRSDLVFESPNRDRDGFVPLGNGSLGSAVWAADGLTAQLNRADNFPTLASAGRLVVPGVAPMLDADDYEGRLILADGVYRQSGGGTAATTYVHADRDALIVEVEGAPPDRRQIAQLRLWEPRTPETVVLDDAAGLAETWAGVADAEQFGSLSALAVDARDATAHRVDPHTVELRFRPREDGRYRVVAAGPSYRGDADPADAVREAVDGLRAPSADALAAPTREWWHEFWDGVHPFRLSSADGTAEYVEALRTFDLYVQAAANRGSEGFPVTHGAVAEAFRPNRDDSDWSPAHFWHWNLRTEVHANFKAGTWELNEPYFRLYRERLDAVADWTADHLAARDAEGAAVPEIMRYDGSGDLAPFEDGVEQLDDDADPYWTGRILSTGAEVAFNAWCQYRHSGDDAFLDRHASLAVETARFLLSYAREDDDGTLYVGPSNALENQWDTRNPATDLAAMRVLFPVAADLADDPDRDPELAARLRAAVEKLPAFPRDPDGTLAWSELDRPSHNFQNPELEAVWPWGLFDDAGDAGTELARRTFLARDHPQTHDWAPDAIQAARLGLADEVRDLLLAGIEDFQVFPCGFQHYAGERTADRNSPYFEWTGVLRTALHEALVQRHDGLLRVAPAWPVDWDVDAALRVEGGHLVATQVRAGVPAYVGIEAAADETVRLRNPWPGAAARVVDGDDLDRADPVVETTDDRVLGVPVEAGRRYVVERADSPYEPDPDGRLTGGPADRARRLRGRTYGLPDDA